MLGNAGKLFVLALLGTLLAGPAVAVTVLIDFEAFDGTPAVGWNMIDSADSGSVLDLLDTTGIDSGIDVAVPTVLDNGGAFDAWNDANPLPAWAPDAAADDYVWMNGFIVAFTFSGLDPALTYDIDLIVSRDLSRSQDMRMAAGNGNFDVFDWNSQADGYVAGNTLSWTGLAPDAGGVITFLIRRDQASSALNAMRIQSVPEPSVVLLLAWAALPLLQARRRA